MSRTDLQGRANRLRSRRVPFVLATVVRAERPTSAKAGDCALVLPDGTIEGFVGGSCAESTVRLQGLRLLQTGESTLLRITPTEQGPQPDPAPDERGPARRIEGLVTVGNPCLSGGTLEIFLEAMIPPTLVQVYGEAPVARAVVAIGRAAGYDVRPVTEPGAPIPPDTDSVVVASHGRDEEELLAAAVVAGVRYVALVASRRRGAAVLSRLPEAQRSRVHTPAGLDIGARSASEVALSILAELVATRPPRHPTAGPLAAPLVEPLAAPLVERWASQASLTEGWDAHTSRAAGGARAQRAAGAPGAAGALEAAGAPGAAGETAAARDTGAAGDTAAAGDTGAAGDGRAVEAADPVCGMGVAAVSASLRLDYGGRTWFFCGGGCQQAFADDPGRYAG